MFFNGVVLAFLFIVGFLIVVSLFCYLMVKIPFLFFVIIIIGLVMSIGHWSNNNWKK